MDSRFIAALPEGYFDSLYREWQQSPEGVPVEWHHFLSGFELGSNGTVPPGQLSNDSTARKLSGVQSALYRYRSLGHLLACTDPLSPCQLSHPLLELSQFGLDETDLDTVFPCRRFMKSDASLREIVETLRETYCREIGVEFMHIQDPDERQWLIDRMEPCRNRPELDEASQLHILEKLHQAALFESFLHRRFVGQKRFSLEGGEVLIPVLDRVVSSGARSGITDVILGMSHRGRLNVLAHILGKPYENIFAEFKESISPGFTGEGDVKYHKGYSSDREFDGKRIHVTIAANPSHLEAVNAVVEGKCRARQDRYEGTPEGSNRVVPVLVHGDAAFAGQGSVMEVLNLSQLDGYSTGGTLHIVLNNQIGFTTLPRDSRSTSYATDVAKMLSCPLFHVQGEAPEAAVHAVDLAMEYRRVYGRDVVIELVCYRRHGHNEGDEPAFTQPKMYQQVASRPSVNKIYRHTLAEESRVAPERLDQLEQKVLAQLEASFTTPPLERAIGFSDRWSDFSAVYSTDAVATAVASEQLRSIADRVARIPEGFIPHGKIATLVEKRREAVKQGVGIDWGNAETLAYGSLLEEGYSIRLSGQDSRRGTFNHRHCVLIDSRDEKNHTPLAALASNGATFQVWNSSLSEFGVLGFEYGYSLETPHCLTIWEAQFGDFANGAQVIIDQFIAGGETKWNRASGLVMLLPHGYEGQGAEHSSARIERFLQLSAGENMLIATPSTPAQMFHLLRRQLHQKFRKPLVVFTPKSLLRHPDCSSELSELSEGGFQPIIVGGAEPGTADKVIFCSGKIFYDLEAELQRRTVSATVVVRIEQLYPLDSSALRTVLETIPAQCRLLWVQEEPENMGAWHFIERHFRRMQREIVYIGREENSCPAVGSHHLHAVQQAEILDKALL